VQVCVCVCVQSVRQWLMIYVRARVTRHARPFKQCVFCARFTELVLIIFGFRCSECECCTAVHYCTYPHTHTHTHTNIGTRTHTHVISIIKVGIPSPILLYIFIDRPVVGAVAPVAAPARSTSIK